jgi:hypothetical protein
MLCEESLKTVQAIAILYSAKNANTLDDETLLGLAVVADLVCFITGHSCLAALEMAERLEQMKKELEDDQINIAKAMDFVEMMEARTVDLINYNPLRKP